MVLMVIGITSCGEDFLDEQIQDSLTTSNAFSTKADFQASVNDLYALVRMEFYTRNDNDPMLWLYRTDLVYQIANASANLTADFVPSGGLPTQKWNNLYKIVAESNTIISRLQTADLVDADKIWFEAQARFFRAFSYRALAYLFGGVPLITEEVVNEQVAFTRATKDEVLALAIDDLIFAAANLHGINDNDVTTKPKVLDGEVLNVAAQHLLAEVYIADGQYDKAIQAATVAIDDPDTDLMMARYGTRSGVTPGDVYWDLFQKNNQNRKTAKNKEALWVIQIEQDKPGGSAVSTSQTDSYLLERVHPPLLRDFRVNGAAPFSWPVGDYTGGRGVGFMAPSVYFLYDAWVGTGASDMRNANHNFVRKIKSNNPASPLYGTDIDFDNLPANSSGLSGAMTSGKPDRAFYPYQVKSTQPFNHPAALYQTGPVPYFLSASAGGTYTDQYMFRLAETYLLRAEAYFLLGNSSLAADDINVVRNRAGATPIVSGDVNIDFILDERMRELGVEEKRILTLMRTGQFYARLIKCSPTYYGPTADPKFNLWPIPQSEIDRNRGAVLEQNPGY